MVDAVGRAVAWAAKRDEFGSVPDGRCAGPQKRDTAKRARGQRKRVCAYEPETQEKHKMEIVGAFKAHGAVVAKIGDGGEYQPLFCSFVCGSDTRAGHSCCS